ncbi:MAG: hypothetical protein M3R41_00860 [Pseudomonadota bacterium]|nr:hypothetical protein [Pseudomonadota bacterium]
MALLTEKPIERIAGGSGGFIVSALGPDMVPETLKPWVLGFGIVLILTSLIWPILKPSFWRSKQVESVPPADPKMLSLFKALQHVKSTSGLTWEEATKQIQEFFGTGVIRTRGFWNGEKDRDTSRRNIPAEKWSTLYIPPEIRDHDLNFAQSMSEPGQFLEITVDHSDLLREYPNSPTIAKT